MELNGLNPTALSKAIGVPQSTVHRILAGTSKDPRTSNLAPIANFFHVSLEALQFANLEEMGFKKYEKIKGLIRNVLPVFEGAIVRLQAAEDRQKAEALIECRSELSNILDGRKHLNHLDARGQLMVELHSALRCMLADERDSIFSLMEKEFKKEADQLREVTRVYKANNTKSEHYSFADALYDPANIVINTASQGAKPIPILSYAQVRELDKDIATYSMSGNFVSIFTDTQTSRWAFALEIPDDAMQPEFKPGDRIIIDPDVPPQPGDFVLADSATEGVTFKKYRPVRIDANGITTFELIPLNNDYLTLVSDTNQLRIIGTMVEHRRYRKSR